MTAASPRTAERRRIAVAAVVTLLVLVNLARSLLVPADAHLALNLSLAVVVAMLGWAGGLGLVELGLDPGRVREGLVWGGGALVVIALVIAMSAAGSAVIPALAEAFEDERARIGVGELVLRAAVIIPIGTVMVEELAFRGVLLGALLGRWRTQWAVATSSVLFGLWHLLPVARAAQGAAGTSAGIAGTMIATTIAGVVFCWLRLRSGSLIAPILAHIGTNSGALIAAWLLN